MFSVSLMAGTFVVSYCKETFTWIGEKNIHKNPECLLQRRVVQRCTDLSTSSQMTVLGFVSINKLRPYLAYIKFALVLEMGNCVEINCAQFPKT
jgi:hypothetical protein